MLPAEHTISTPQVPPQQSHSQVLSCARELSFEHAMIVATDRVTIVNTALICGSVARARAHLAGGGLEAGLAEARHAVAAVLLTLLVLAPARPRLPREQSRASRSATARGAWAATYAWSQTPSPMKPRKQPPLHWLHSTRSSSAQSPGPTRGWRPRATVRNASRNCNRYWIDHCADRWWVAGGSRARTAVELALVVVALRVADAVADRGERADRGAHAAADRDVAVAAIGPAVGGAGVHVARRVADAVADPRGLVAGRRGERQNETRARE